MSIFTDIRRFFSRKAEPTPIAEPVAAPALIEAVPTSPPPDVITQEDRAASKTAYAAAHPISDEKNYARPVIGVTRLPSGAVFMGQGRYGLSSGSQARVYAEAMSLWKSGADPAKLMLILSRLVEPYVFDTAVIARTLRIRIRRTRVHIRVYECGLSADGRIGHKA